MKHIHVHGEVGWGGRERFIVTFLGRGGNSRILGSNKGGIFFSESLKLSFTSTFYFVLVLANRLK